VIEGQTEIALAFAGGGEPSFQAFSLCSRDHALPG